jgi:hypothetical protein
MRAFFYRISDGGRRGQRFVSLINPHHPVSRNPS